ncbi:MAG: glucosaminidase domain-containing protein [Methanofastidiosum sp.]|jgi:hypothetical protein
MTLNRIETRQAMRLAHKLRREAAERWKCESKDISFGCCLEQAYKEIKERKATTKKIHKRRKINLAPFLFLLISSLIIILVLGTNTINNRYQNTIYLAVEENKRLLKIINTHGERVQEIRDLHAGEVAELYDCIGILEELLFYRINTYSVAINNQGANMKIHTPSGFTADDLERAWKALSVKGMYGTGEYFEKAEQLYGVNMVFLSALAYHESRGGLSKIAKDKNNLFGWGAYDRDPYRYAYNFPTREEGINHVAREIESQYLSRGLDTPRAMNILYASDPLWAYNISRVMKLIVQAAIDKPEEMLSYEWRTMR